MKSVQFLGVMLVLLVSVVSNAVNVFSLNGQITSLRQEVAALKRPIQQAADHATVMRNLYQQRVHDVWVARQSSAPLSVDLLDTETTAFATEMFNRQMERNVNEVRSPRDLNSLVQTMESLNYIAFAVRGGHVGFGVFKNSADRFEMYLADFPQADRDSQDWARSILLDMRETAGTPAPSN